MSASQSEIICHCSLTSPGLIHTANTHIEEICPHVRVYALTRVRTPPPTHTQSAAQWTKAFCSGYRDVRREIGETDRRAGSGMTK